MVHAVTGFVIKVVIQLNPDTVVLYKAKYVVHVF